MGNHNWRIAVLSVFFGMGLFFNDSYARVLPDLDSVYNKICLDRYKKFSHNESEVFLKFLVTAVHLTIDDFFGSDINYYRKGFFDVFLENNPIFSNYRRIPLRGIYTANLSWYKIHNIYGYYPKEVINYFKEAKFVVSVSTLLKGHNLSVTVSLENFKVLDKYTAYLYNIADYTYRFEYLCESNKWIFSDIEKMFYTEPKKQIMHPIGFKYDDGK